MQGLSAAGMRTFGNIQLHINKLEMKAVELALNTFSTMDHEKVFGLDE